MISVSRSSWQIILVFEMVIETLGSYTVTDIAPAFLWGPHPQFPQSGYGVLMWNQPMSIFQSLAHNPKMHIRIFK